MKNMTITCLVQYVPVSLGSMVSQYQGYCHAHGGGMPRHGMVLAGHRSCDWYDQQGEPGSDHHRVIARLIYPTQCSKCHSGVLIFQF